MSFPAPSFDFEVKFDLNQTVPKLVIDDNTDYSAYANNGQSGDQRVEIMLRITDPDLIVFVDGTKLDFGFTPHIDPNVSRNFTVDLPLSGLVAKQGAYKIEATLRAVDASPFGSALESVAPDTPSAGKTTFKITGDLTEVFQGNPAITSFDVIGGSTIDGTYNIEDNSAVVYSPGNDNTEIVTTTNASGTDNQGTMSFGGGGYFEFFGHLTDSATTKYRDGGYDTTFTITAAMVTLAEAILDPTFNSSVDFDLVTLPADFLVTDNTDYVAAGLALADIKGLVKLIDPNNGIVYENINYGSPDITPNSSRDFQGPALPVDGDGIYLKGNYQFEYSVQAANQSYTFTIKDIVASTKIITVDGDAKTFDRIKIGDSIDIVNHHIGAFDATYTVMLVGAYDSGNDETEVTVSQSFSQDALASGEVDVAKTVTYSQATSTNYFISAGGIVNSVEETNRNPNFRLDAKINLDSNPVVMELTDISDYESINTNLNQVDGILSIIHRETGIVVKSMPADFSVPDIEPNLDRRFVSIGLPLDGDGNILEGNYDVLYDVFISQKKNWYSVFASDSSANTITVDGDVRDVLAVSDTFSILDNAIAGTYTVLGIVFDQANSRSTISVASVVSNVSEEGVLEVLIDTTYSPAVSAAHEYCKITPPVMCFDVSHSCTASTIISKDTTSYGVGATLLSREHRLSSPDTIPAAQRPADYVTSGDTITLRNIWTGIYTTLITTVVQVQLDSGLYVCYTVTGSKTYNVSCDTSLCCISDCLDAIAVRLEIAACDNPKEAERLRRLTSEINFYYSMYSIARACGDETKQRLLSDKIKSLLVSEACDCGCDDTGVSVLIEPSENASQFIGTAYGQWIIDEGVPDVSLGVDGSIYLDVTTSFLYKKISGAWDYSGTLGTEGPAGTNGNTLISGSGAPTTAGVDGDSYIDIDTNFIYGPKAVGVWPAWRAMNGNTVLNGSGAPSDVNDGSDGDYYIDNNTSDMYGPKAAGAWPAAVSLIGPVGQAGTGHHIYSVNFATGAGITIHSVLFSDIQTAIGATPVQTLFPQVQLFIGSGVVYTMVSPDLYQVVVDFGASQIDFSLLTASTSYLVAVHFKTI